MTREEKKKQPKGWQWVRLGEICAVFDKLRKPVTKKDRIAGAFPYYGATGVLDYVNDYIFDETLVLIGEDGAKWGAGEKTAFLAEGKYWVNNHAHVVRPDRNIILDNWLIYYLNCIDVSEHVTGLTVPKLNQARLKQILIPIPPLAEQERIVMQLDRQLAAVERAYLAAEVQVEATDALPTTLLRETFTSKKAQKIPMDALCKIEYGTRIVSKRDGGAKYPVYGGGGRTFKADTFNRSSRVIISRFAMSEKCTRFVEGNFFLNDSGLTVSPNNSKILMPFLNYQILSFNDDIYALGRGAAQRNLYMPAFRQLPLVMMPLSDQKKIVARLDKQFAIVKKTRKAIEEQSTFIRALPDSLLRQAFSGAV